MPGPPPRQHKHERQYSPSTHSVIPTRRIWNDDDDGQKIFGDLGCLKCPHICLTGEEKPRKNLIQETCPDRGSNPGPLRDKRACYHLLHSSGLELVLNYVITTMETGVKLHFVLSRKRQKNNFKMYTNYPTFHDRAALLFNDLRHRGFILSHPLTRPFVGHELRKRSEGSFYFSSIPHSQIHCFPYK